MKNSTGSGRPKINGSDQIRILIPVHNSKRCIFKAFIPVFLWIFLRFYLLSFIFFPISLIFPLCLRIENPPPPPPLTFCIIYIPGIDDWSSIRPNKGHCTFFTPSNRLAAVTCQERSFDIFQGHIVCLESLVVT